MKSNTKWVIGLALTRAKLEGHMKVKEIAIWQANIVVHTAA